MKTKTAGILSFLCLLSTVLFLVFFVLDMSMAGPITTFEQALAHARLQTTLSTLAYTNVTLLTLLVPMLMAALYELCKSLSPTWCKVALVFTPVYCVLNLFSYFSQITIVPRLLELADRPEMKEMAEFLLRQLLQSWPDSAVSISNNTAYGILGIPSIIFGVLLYKKAMRFRTGGILLAVNGAACLLGVIGFALRQPLLSSGSLVGAVFFLASLVPLSIQFLRREGSAGLN